MQSDRDKTRADNLTLWCGPEKCVICGDTGAERCIPGRPDLLLCSECFDRACRAAANAIVSGEVANV